MKSVGNVDEREILTEGKLLLLACENGSLQGFGLHSRKKAGDICDVFVFNAAVPLLLF